MVFAQARTWAKKGVTSLDKNNLKKILLSQNVLFHKTEISTGEDKVSI